MLKFKTNVMEQTNHYMEWSIFNDHGKLKRKKWNTVKRKRLNVL